MAEYELANRRLVALQYFARLPPRDVHFQWPSPRSLLGIQEYIFDDLCLNRDKQDGVDYKRRFLKHTLSMLQAAVDAEESNTEVEVCGDLLEAYAGLMAIAKADITSTSQQVLYYYPVTEVVHESISKSRIFGGWNCITVQEEISTVSRGTTGLKTWESSLRLAAHLVTHPEILKRKDLVILELGSGSGLLGVVVARHARHAQIHLTDRDGIVLDHLHKTIDENVLDSRNVKIAPLDWLEIQEDGSDASSRYLASIQPHLILAADTIYDPVNLEPFCQVLKIALSWKGGTTSNKTPYALLASPIRNEQTYSLFLKVIDRNGMAVQVDPLQSPKIDLPTAKLSSSAGQVRLFPSVHDDFNGGPVLLLKITNCPAND